MNTIETNADGFSMPAARLLRHDLLDRCDAGTADGHRPGSQVEQLVDEHHHVGDVDAAVTVDIGLGEIEL